MSDVNLMAEENPMKDSYKVMLQRNARRAYELRTESDRAKTELDDARARYEQLVKELRDHENQLCQSVGANQPEKLWRVDTGISVIARHHSTGGSTVSVLYDQDSE